MKIAAFMIMLPLATLGACQVQSSAPSTSGSDTGGEPTSGEAAADAGHTVDASTDASPGASTPPAQLVGTSWTWTTSAGAQKLTFGAGGVYTSDVVLNGHPGDACGTEYFTHREGTASFDGPKMTLASTASTRTKTNTCSDQVLSKDAIDQDVRTYGWRLEASPEALVLTSDDGTETTYVRD